MKTFRKYQFSSKGAATTKINQLGVDEDGNPTDPDNKVPVEISAAICFGVILGYLALFVVSLFIT